MQNNANAKIKEAIIEYAKSHSEYAGEILDLLNHIDEASKIAQSLPMNIQMELKTYFLQLLVINGILPKQF